MKTEQYSTIMYFRHIMNSRKMDPITKELVQKWTSQCFYFNGCQEVILLESLQELHEQLRLDQTEIQLQSWLVCELKAKEMVAWTKYTDTRETTQEMVENTRPWVACSKCFYILDSLQDIVHHKNKHRLWANDTTRDEIPESSSAIPPRRWELVQMFKPLYPQGPTEMELNMAMKQLKKLARESNQNSEEQQNMETTQPEPETNVNQEPHEDQDQQSSRPYGRQ